MWSLYTFIAVKYYQHTYSNHTLLPVHRTREDTLTSTATTFHCEYLEEEILPREQSKCVTTLHREYMEEKILHRQHRVNVQQRFTVNT